MAVQLIDPNQALSRLGTLKSGRSGFDGFFEEIRKVTFPGASEFTSQPIRGAKLHKDVFDGSGEMAAEMLASALFGMATNPATKWLGIRPQDRDLLDDEEIALWYEDATLRMLAMFNNPATAFATQQFLKLQNFVSFGTAPQFIAERPGGVPLFQTAALTECFIDDGDDGKVDTVYRLYTRTPRQLAQKFKTGLPVKILEKALDPKRMDENVEILHVVEPRHKREAGRIDGLNKPWREAYIVVADKHLIGEGGFDENPWVCPRMNPRPGEVYGRGRGMTAHADTKMLQRSMKSTIRAAEKRTDPPTQVFDDGVMSPIAMTAGAINVIRADLAQFPGGAIRAIDTGADPIIGEEFNGSIRHRIDRAYWLPILQAFTDPKMTATQVLKLDEQTLRFIGPILGRMQSEDLGPMAARVFPIMLRGGQFLPVPAAMENTQWEVEYVSPIAKAQRLEEARGLAETFDLLAPMLNTHPEGWDNLDVDAAFRATAELRSVPKNLLRGKAAVKQIRDARAQAATAAEQSQALTTGAPAAAKMISALSQAGAQAGAGGQPDQQAAA